MAATSAVPDLPLSTSPSLALVHPTETEKLAIWQLNGQSWRGRLSLSDYYRREQVLDDQTLTRDGGMTFWALVDGASAPSSSSSPAPRQILASCQSWKKRGLVGRGGVVDEVVSHSIGNVFCDPALRGRGYAGRMMKELGMKLHMWQQDGGKETEFTVLFSDIGKKFYTAAGWRPYRSTHVTLPCGSSVKQASFLCEHQLQTAKPLHSADLDGLCDVDEKLLKSKIAQASLSSKKTHVALVPNVTIFQWHHAREEFIADVLWGRVPLVKGAEVEIEEGKRVWCVWTRTFGDADTANILHILRLVIESETEFRDQQLGFGNDHTELDGKNKRVILAVASVLRAAQREAAQWKMQCVQLWNPTPFGFLAAREIEREIEMVDREQKSIASLRWDDSEHIPEIEWVANEKYSWC